MIYRVTMRKHVNQKLSFYVQTFWVDINVQSDDNKLEEKILFGLRYNEYDNLKDNDSVGYGDTTIEIIPFPEYPGFQTAQSELLDLNNSLEPNEKKHKDNHWFDVIGMVRCCCSEDEIDDKKLALNCAISNALRRLEENNVICSSSPFLGPGWAFEITEKEMKKHD